jgi:hypothetical protein
MIILFLLHIELLYAQANLLYVHIYVLRSAPAKFLCSYWLSENMDEFLLAASHFEAFFLIYCMCILKRGKSCTMSSEMWAEQLQLPWRRVGRLNVRKWRSGHYGTGQNSFTCLFDDNGVPPTIFRRGIDLSPSTLERKMLNSNCFRA